MKELKLDLKENKKIKVKEPLIRISKRGEMKLWKAIGIRAIAFIIAMLVSGVVAYLLVEKLHDNPKRIGQFYKCFVTGAFANSALIWRFLKNVAVLLMIALALTPAYKMKFWNTGAEGQVLIGILASTAIMRSPAMCALPNWLQLLLMLLASLLAGAIWNGLPGIAKALWNTNETLFTLMMNYVAQFLTSFMLLKWVPTGTALGVLNRETHEGWLPTVINENFLIIVISLVMAVTLYVYFKYSKHGYEISVVGESENTARYIGINVKKVVVRTAVMSGMLCGLVGFLMCAGLTHSISATTVNGQGFTGIMVSWLANFNPLVMIGTSGLVIFLQTGAEEISNVFYVSGAMPEIIVGIILLFIIGSEFFIKYKLHFKGQKVKAAKQMEGIK